MAGSIGIELIFRRLAISQKKLLALTQCQYFGARLVNLGETDQTFVSTFIDDLPDFVTNLEVYRIADAGHSPMLETPALVSDKLMAFLAS